MTGLSLNNKESNYLEKEELMNKKSYIAYRAYGAEQTLCLNPVKSIEPKKKKISNKRSDISFLKSFVVVIFGFTFFLAYSAYAEDEIFYPSEENEGWEIRTYSAQTVALTKQGHFSADDKLFFVMWPYEGDCDFADVGFFVYSEKEVEDHKYIEDKKFIIKVGSDAYYEYLNTYVVANNKFLDGFRSFFSIDSYSLDSIMRSFGSTNNFMIQLTDTNENINQIIEEEGMETPDDILVDEYFDIKRNVWDLRGLEKYLLKTISICETRSLVADAIS